MTHTLLIFLIALGLGVPAFVHADPHPDVTIAGHITPVISKGHCTTAKPTLTSSQLVVDVQEGTCSSGQEYTVWLFVCSGSDSVGIAGMEFGIDYNPLIGSGGGVDVNSTVLCADLQFPSPAWPDAGSGIIITWDPDTNCQNTLSEPFVPRTVIAIGMAMNVSVYSPDQLFITPRPVSGRAKVADCNAAEYDVTESPYHTIRRLGILGFCAPGWQLCEIGVPVESTTWGRLKTLSDS